MTHPNSSPSSGASFDSALRDVGEKNLPLSLSSEAVQALAAAGQALLAFASAVQKDTPSNASKAFRPTPLPYLIDTATVNEAVNELLKVKNKSGRSLDYLKNLRGHLVSFSRGMCNAPVAEIHTGRIEAWLERLNVNPRTRKGYLDSVRLLFNFAMRRGYATCNPALMIESPPDPSLTEPVTIHTPAQVARVLDSMRHVDLNVCRFIAIRYFAGLRASETQKCIVQLDRGFIEVTAAVAKTRRRRIVTIQPVLAEWLKLGGDLPLRDMNTRIARATARTGVLWHRNVTRHTFCSMHLAQWQNAGKTALEAGHGEQMLFSHYRELVTAQAASEFWSLTPDVAASVAKTFPVEQTKKNKTTI